MHIFVLNPRVFIWPGKWRGFCWSLKTLNVKSRPSELLTFSSDPTQEIFQGQSYSWISFPKGNKSHQPLSAARRWRKSWLTDLGVFPLCNWGMAWDSTSTQMTADGERCSKAMIVARANTVHLNHSHVPALTLWQVPDQAFHMHFLIQLS